MAVFLRLFSHRHSPRRSSLEDVAAVSPCEKELLNLGKPPRAEPATVAVHEAPADLEETPPSWGCTQSLVAGFVVSVCLVLVWLFPMKEVLRLVVECQKNSPATYVFTYIIAGLLVPAPLLSVLAGVLMGPSLLAAIVILCGSFGSACLAFTISRFLLRQFVVRRFVRRSKRLQAIELALQKDSVKLVLCTRMILPFTFNNYFLGTTPISATTFALSTILTGVPFAVLYAIIGGELQSLDSALAAESFALQGTQVNVFGLFTVSKKNLEVTGICAGVCLCFFVVRTVKQFASRVLAEAQHESRG
ncbi:hypothetical protein, conserved [Eimeria brunetti]|uniref:VTT domain-containing protein n=1 Tax=Eimeria brunetti TaxID=51314 RepID=U6LD52_9EIME|nr:hypothetical protein, conserved [Eimeria brunetti]